MAGYSLHIGSMSNVGHLASGKDSRQRKGPSSGFRWINLSKSCAFRHPASTDPNLYSQDKYRCHRSPSVPGHKFNLSSIILVRRYNFHSFTSTDPQTGQGWDHITEDDKAFWTQNFFFIWLLFV